MKKLILIALFSTFPVTVAVWWIGFRGDSHQAASTTTDSNPTSPLGQHENSPDIESSNEEAEPLEAQSSPATRRIVHVPPGKISAVETESAFNDLSIPTPENLADYGKHNLEAALAGDLNAGYRVGRVLYRCFQMPKTIEGVEISVTGRSRAFERMREQGQVVPTTLQTEAENRAELLGWHKACLQQNDYFNNELREELDSLARQGHVIARYLFAVWSPEFIGKDDAFLIQQDWASKANTYSLLNLEQGELAGLLAFAQSYSGMSLFTTRDSNLGTAFYKAAIDCGLEEAVAEARVESFFNSERIWEYREDVRPQVLAMAEGLKTFCY